VVDSIGIIPDSISSIDSFKNQGKSYGVNTESVSVISRDC
jgi:hypothetical protein